MANSAWKVAFVNMEQWHCLCGLHDSMLCSAWCKPVHADRMKVTFVGATGTKSAC